MGILDFIKTKKQEEPAEPLRNYPQMLTTKLLFVNKPLLDKERIMAELKLFSPKAHSPETNDALLFFFPETEVVFEDGAVAAQCTIFRPNQDNEKAEITPEAFQQNWHWEAADEVATQCNYEILVSDFMTRTLDYKSRVELFINFLTAVTRVVNPQVVYPVETQKLVAPDDLLDAWNGPEPRILHGLVNVRLFNISNGMAGETLMDTVGLHLLGVPDFQIRFADLDPSAVGQALWNYAYYVYENGDVIADGNTIQGVTPDSKWKCERQVALVGPERVVIDLNPS